MELWEQVVIGVVMVMVVLWVLPGTRKMVEASRDAPKDWMGLLIPVGAVVLFVIFLILVA